VTSVCAGVAIAERLAEDLLAVLSRLRDQSNPRFALLARVARGAGATQLGQRSL